MKYLKLKIDDLLVGLDELTEEEFKVWLFLLCYAGRSKTPGIIEKPDGTPYRIETLADLLNYPEKRFQEILNKLEALGKIKLSVDGKIEVVNFKKYMSSYERYYKKLYEEKKKKGGA